jgi:hypothetical protein
MKYSEINKYLFAFKTILAGLLITQFIGTIHVYLSNKALLKSMQLVQNAGYLAVPNEHVWGQLQGFSAAFWGGLFFTLSIGTGLSVVALICAWSWDRLFDRRKAALFIYLPLWLIGIGLVNANGFSAMATAYMIMIPLVVFPVALLWLPPRQEQGDRFNRIAYLGVPVLLLLLFLPLAKKSIFLDIRDTVLLSNPIGKKITGFYYDYTLYAAQAFKSLEQKTICTCRLTLAENESYRPAIENIFLANDYLVIDGDGPVDLNVIEQDDKLLFMSMDQIILTPTFREFAAKPSSAFEQFSQKTDRFGPLRIVAFASMAIGAPLCLYIILHGLFFLLSTVVMNQRRTDFSALLLCVFAGIAIALPLYGIKTQTVDTNNVNAILDSERWQERVAALRYLSDKGLSNDQIAEDYPNWLESSSIAERYWYVRALGANKNPAAYKALMTALDDPSTNVVCMAYYGLGLQKNKSAIDKIKKEINLTNQWYEQLYAYRALKTLGWKQTK